MVRDSASYPGLYHSRTHCVAECHMQTHAMVNQLVTSGRLQELCNLADNNSKGIVLLCMDVPLQGNNYVYSYSFELVKYI